MRKKLAFVLGGGGGRGALQVGALEALLEAGFQPDILVGTSIGAVNAAFLAVHGYSAEGVEQLKQAWRQASKENLLPPNYLWLSVRSLFNRPPPFAVHRLRDFLMHWGISPELTFHDLKGAKLYMVAADLNHHCLEIYGRNPTESVLEGVLASRALPPWASVMEVEDRLLIDGGALSNLPIEPALSLGATEIIALDLSDLREFPIGIQFGPFVLKLISAIQARQVELEEALADQCHVPVHRIVLQGQQTVPVWDFHGAEQLILEGYRTAHHDISRWKTANEEPSHRAARPPAWKSLLAGLRRSKP